MGDRLYSHDDFEAVIRIYGTDEGGRRTPPCNGIKWDFAYADRQPAETIYMIWPDFFGADGRSLPTNAPLPVDVDLCARMAIVVDQMRDTVHRDRIAPGIRFYCHEGGRRVAEGVVTRLTELFAWSTIRLREEDIRLDVGRTGDGSGRGWDFMRMVHVPTGIERIHHGPLKNIDRYELEERWLQEIEAEVVARGLTQHLVPAYRRKSKRQHRGQS